MHSQKQILDFIRENKVVLRERFHISKIGIFGSFARKEQSANSDIDLSKIEVRNFFKEKFDLGVDICREKYIKSHYKKRILNEAIYVD